MANYGDTFYRIEGSKEDLEKVGASIKKALETHDERTSPGREGNVLIDLGEQKKEVIEMRGFVEEYSLDDNCLSIYAREAWRTTDFRFVLKKLMPDLTIYYSFEEAGNDIFETNDLEGKYFPNRFVLDGCINGEDIYDYFKTENELIKSFAKRIGLEIISRDDVDEWNKEHEGDRDEYGSHDNYISIHEFEVVDDSDSYYKAIRGLLHLMH